MYTFTHFHHIPEAEICALYDRVMSEGLYDAFFYNRQQTSAEGFAAYACRDAWCARIDLDGETMGFMMLSDFSGEAAYVHYCAFRAGVPHTAAAALAGFEWLRKNCPSVTVLVGVTPAHNMLMLRFLERVGFTVIGRAPRALSTTTHGTVDAVLSYLDLREAGQK